MTYSIITTAEHVVEDVEELFHFWHKQFECPEGLCDGSGKDEDGKTCVCRLDENPYENGYL